ncbi:MAG: hypothetical protein PHQ74_12270 [Crocinitomicaceae bacterium]|nr:hypothetical protein [Crocinitomicaceae bacterium]
MKKFFKIFAFIALTLSITALQSCKRDPSVLKVYVRSQSNQLVPGAKVVIIGDVNSNPVTRPYVDTVMTNSTGYALFDMTGYFGEKGKKGEIGYFDIIVKKDTLQALGRVRCRVNITNVETIYLP